MDKWEEKQNRLTVLIDKRTAGPITREEAHEIHELQKQLWAHRKNSTEWPSHCVSQRVFGKRIADMSKEERREYERIVAENRGIKRKSVLESRVRTMFGKTVADLTPGELYIYANTCQSRKRVANPYSHCISRQLFGKPLKELTKEEYRAYIAELNKRRKGQ